MTLKVYRPIFKLEVPNLPRIVIQVPVKSYNKLGDPERAVALVSKHPYTVPARILAILGLDPFFARVKNETNSIDVITFLTKCQDLNTDLERVRRRTIKSSYGPEDKAV